LSLNTLHGIVMADETDSLSMATCLRGHQQGIAPGSEALSLGHALEEHLRSYPLVSG
jgi:hypothetical protein